MTNAIALLKFYLAIGRASPLIQSVERPEIKSILLISIDANRELHLLLWVYFYLYDNEKKGGFANLSLIHPVSAIALSLFETNC